MDYCRACVINHGMGVSCVRGVLATRVMASKEIHGVGLHMCAHFPTHHFKMYSHQTY